jgi:molecular chaperone GrpE
MNEDVKKNNSETVDDDEVTQSSAVEDVSPDLEKKVKELEEKYLRTYADFENYRKRASKEKEEVRQSTSELLLRELLEVKDHLELALSHSTQTQAAPEFRTLRDGVHLTLKQLENFLKKFGVEEVHPLGENFNPAFHEAIQQEESREYAPGAVVRVYQKGYLMKGRLLRAARVAVAAAPKENM